MVDGSSAGVAVMAVLAVNDAGCWILDAGSAGVLEKTVSAWKDAGCGSECRSQQHRYHQS